MSVQFAPTHGLKQNLTPAVNMAVGSSVDPAGATAARSAEVHPKQPRISDNHCYGLPYQDHNYGARPPPTPPESPMPGIAEPSQASVFNDVALDTCDRFSEAPTVTIKCAAAPRTHDLLATSLSQKIDSTKVLAENVNGDAGDLTRCICGFQHDDGYMICCDKCSVWQHIDCMQIDRNSIPETYLCEKCNPRLLDHVRAARLQKKKHEEFISCTDFDSVLSGSGDDSPCENVLYTAIHSTPTSITLSTNRKRNHPPSVGKKRKRSADNIKIIKNNDTSKRQRSKSFLSDDMEDEYGPLKVLWRMKMKQWSKSYQEAGDKNRYTESVQSAIHGSSARVSDAEKAADSPDIITQLKAQLAKVQQLRNTLLAMEDIHIGQPVIEYQGCFSLARQFEVPMAKIYEKPYPYILFYSGFDGLDICIDARTYGNKARYIRRSCSPNSEVRHILDKGLLRLFVYSSKLIKKETEITLPFDVKYENCSYMLPCACATKDCPVHRSNRKKAHINSEVRNNNNNHGHKRLAPLRLSLGNLPCNQINGYVSSEDSTTCDTEENAVDNQRKKSREERKMEAYIRAFEKLEKKERKKEQMQQHANERGLPEESKIPLTSSSTDMSALTVTTPAATLPSQEASSNAKVENPSLDATVPSTSAQAVVPQKRVARRRSGRVRRGSRKYHGEFYQTSTMLGRKDSDIPSDIFLPISEDSCDSANQELAKLLPPCDQPEFTSFTTTPSASVPSVPALSNAQNSSSARPSLSTFTLHQKHNNFSSSTTNPPISGVIPTTIILETNKSDSFQSAFSPTISIENCATSRYNLQSSTHSETMLHRNFTSHVTVSNTKLLSPSSSGRSRSSSGNSKCDESVSRSCSPLFSKTPLCTKPIYPSVSCDVVHWDFKPGLPSRIVPINVQTALRSSRYNPSKPIKKWWLQRAVSDSLLTATTAEQLKQANTVEVSNESPVSVHAEKDSATELVSWKKRLLSETAAAMVDEPDVNDTEPCSAEKSEEEPDQKEECSEHVTSDDEQNEETEGVSELVDKSETSTEMKNEESSVQEISMAAPTEEPTMPQITPTEITTQGSIAEDSNSSSSLMMLPQQAGEDSSFLLDDTSCESVILGQMDTLSDLRQTHYSYPAPVKRKVSLQEYLKRSKETKKPSSTIATSSAVTPVPIAAVPNVSTEPKPNLQTPEATLSVQVAPTVVECKTEPVKPSNSDVAEELLAIKSGKLEPDVLNKVLNHFKDQKEMTGLVNEVVRHLKATQRAKGPKEEPEQEFGKKKEIASSPTKDKGSVSQSPSPRPVPLQKPVSETKPSVNHLSLKKRESGHSPSPKVFSRKQNQSTPSPRNDVAREKDKKRSFTKVSPSDVRSDQPPTEPRKIQSIRSPVVLSREDSWSSEVQTQSRSRHGSGTSSSSSRSPRHHVEHGNGGRYPKQEVHHQHLSRASSDNMRLNERAVSPTLPQKVPCITPAVPGQPIPSLVRSSDGRGPQPVYNRPSPTCDYRAPSPPPPRWQHSPPYMSRNGCAEVGRVPDKYSEPLSPAYSNRYYERDHRAPNREYYRFEDHPPPVRGDYHSNKHQRHYNGPVSRRYSNEGYPPRRTPSPQMCHYRHSNTATPPYYNDNRTPYPNDHRERSGSTYRYHKPPPNPGYSRSPSSSPIQHRRYTSPVPYQPGPNYRNHYQSGYPWQD